jgi:hypothetical protein
LRAVLLPFLAVLDRPKICPEATAWQLGQAKEAFGSRPLRRNKECDYQTRDGQDQGSDDQS